MSGERMVETVGVGDRIAFTAMLLRELVEAEVMEQVVHVRVLEIREADGVKKLFLCTEAEWMRVRGPGGGES